MNKRLGFVLVAVVLVALGWWLGARLVVPLTEARLSAALNRSVQIGGLRFDFGPITDVHVRHLTIDNPEWRANQPFAEFEAIELRFDVFESLREWRPVLPAVSVTGGAVAIVRNAQGVTNAAGLFSPSDKPSKLSIDAFSVRATTFSFVAEDEPLQLHGSIEVEPESAENPLPVALKGEGQRGEQRLEFELALGGLSDWRERAQGFPVRAMLGVGGTKVNAYGRVEQPLALRGFDLSVTASGPNPADLGPVFMLPLPSLPPYEIETRVRDDDGYYRLEEFRGSFGDSDIRGSARIGRTNRRTQVQADLRSKRLDLDDLAGIIGAPPATGPGETASSKQTAEAASNERRARLMPTKPFHLAALDRADVTLRYRAAAIESPRLPLNDVDLRLELQDGALRANPLTVGIGGGEMALDFALDQAASARLAGTFEQVSLRAILGKLDLTNDAAGTISGWLDVSASGRNFAAMMAQLDGDVALLTQGGRLDSVLVELMGIDVGEAIVAHLSSDSTVAIRCGVIDIAATQGILKLEQLVVDTSDTVVRGSGQISLVDERYAMKLKGEAKDLSFFAGDAPIYITGTFKEPVARPDIAQTLLSLLTPIEFGEATDIDCRAMLRSQGAPSTRAAAVSPEQ